MLLIMNWQTSSPVFEYKQVTISRSTSLQSDLVWTLSIVFTHKTSTLDFPTAFRIDRLFIFKDIYACYATYNSVFNYKSGLF